MVYKKYIKRGGKIYGPYKYHSRKVDGKVITEYHGKHKERDIFLIFLMMGLILFSLLVFSGGYTFTKTGSVISENVTGDPIAFISFIIEIIKAEHLDSNKNFISDIYEEVGELDNVWSETINSGDYVRVTFEENLTSKNDITIYPRVVDGDPKIEIYEADGTDVIAEFTNIISNQYNKVLLTNLQQSQDIFDLLILGGSLQFDHIFDPDELEREQGIKKISIKEVKK